MRGHGARGTTFGTAFLGLALLVLIPGCRSGGGVLGGDGQAEVQRGIPPVRLELEGIENAYRIGPGLWSGGEPKGEVAFRVLAEAGVRVMVSVDGARPDVEAAERHGLRYIHVPIGYDGVPPGVQASLASLVREQSGGVFIHCHHGRHRGPAAAAWVARAAGKWTADQAEAWMREAGTSPEYPGLYRSVREFRMPEPAAVERAREGQVPAIHPKGLVESMVAIDGLTEALADMKAAGWRSIPAAPDETPATASRLLHEQFREAVRLGLGPKNPDYVRAMEQAEAGAERLAVSLAGGDHGAADRAWKQVREDCVTCHRAWRNGAP